MRRYTFYLAVAVVAFGVGSFLAVDFYRNALESSEKVEFQVSTEIAVKKFDATEPVFYPMSQAIKEDKEDEKEIAVCRNKQLLPLWNEVKKEKKFRDRAEDYVTNVDCAELLEVQQVDLNNDGRKEFVLWGKPSYLCGGTGNCELWIYEKRKGGFRLLLQAVAYNDVTKWFEVRKTQSKGYRDLLLKGHFTAADTTLDFYKFNGTKYVADKCFMSSFHSYDDKTSVTSCEKFFKELDK